MSRNNQQWDLPDPFIIAHTAESAEVDGYGHINNSVYVQWMDRCVWQHCNAVGMSFEFCRELGKGFAAIRHEIDYLKASYAGDQVLIANWITFNDQKLRAERRFQIIKIEGWITLLRAKSKYVCTDLNSGRPCRMPAQFKTDFVVLESVSKQLQSIDK
jgi:acyl-CoA thioester hydrolase